MKQFLCLYGNVGLVRGFCPNCQSEAIILDNKYTCCDFPIETNPEKVKRMIEPISMRKIPPIAERREILKLQNNCCFYCGNEFDSFVWRIRKEKQKIIKVKLSWDHLIPFKFSQNNFAYNFAAACRTCNSIKSDHIYKNIDEMKIVMAYRRRKIGYVANDDSRLTEDNLAQISDHEDHLEKLKLLENNNK